MSLESNLDELTHPLLSASYESTDEETDVDFVFVPDSRTDQNESDSEIEAITCYREMPIFPPQTAGGVTTKLCTSHVELSLTICTDL